MKALDGKKMNAGSMMMMMIGKGFLRCLTQHPTLALFFIPLRGVVVVSITSVPILAVML